VASGMFEFVTMDHGIGVMASLRKCTKFKQLIDHGKALAFALADGTSRFDQQDRGNHSLEPLLLVVEAEIKLLDEATSHEKIGQKSGCPLL
jgi:hypothetical protein